jgi:signal transduction histidine kinase
MSTSDAAAAWLRLRPMAVDSAIAVALLLLSAGTLLLTSEYTSGARSADLLGVGLVAAACLPLAARRRWPLPVLATVCLPMALLTTHEYAAGTAYTSVLIGVYTVAAYRSRQEARVAALLGSITFLTALPFVDEPVRAADITAIVAVVLAAYAFGRSIGFRRAYTAELELRADRLERAREADLRAVVAEERSRIARELHDVVAHAVSVMTVQAAAAQRTLDRSPQRAREAMAAVEDTGRLALADMRRIVGVLRSDAHEPGELAPQPGVADLDDLVGQVCTAGLACELKVVGTPRPLPSGIDLTVYRLVQEALTNTRKHAGPTRARVTLTYGDQFVHVSVRDDGRGAAAHLSGADQGHGLLGMRERVAVYGGALRAGPGVGGGFEVSARIPLEGAES